MINYVFDTNGIISAHLLRFSVTRQAYDKAIQEGVLVHSKEKLSELVQVFSRPKFDKYLSAEERIKAIELFEKKSFSLMCLLRQMPAVILKTINSLNWP